MSHDLGPRGIHAAGFVASEVAIEEGASDHGADGGTNGDKIVSEVVAVCSRKILPGPSSIFWGYPSQRHMFMRGWWQMGTLLRFG